MNFLQLTDQTVDVSEWLRDKEFREYPVGARDKALLYCPTPAPYPFLRDGHRYLFKLSSHRYPEQFWMEILAYLIGVQMGIPVPPTFISYDSKRMQSGALIEWFLNPIPLVGEENYIPGGDYCQQYIPNFDSKKGKKHNFETVSLIFRDLTEKNPLFFKANWKDYWAMAFTFDALIGNTDRHQDNWGIIMTPLFCAGSWDEKMRISPIFDNGTSMGHEISSDKFQYYQNDANLKKYISKGWHHMKWGINDTASLGHVEMIKKFTSEYPETRDLILNCLKRVNYDTFESILGMLTSFDVPVRLSTERAAFVLRLLQFRHQRLLCELEK
ncbi:MAG TPA: HipA domain-containing protein [Gammaproteobacteria bacterium]|jgi:hypothetical protein|nr:HipA domain-containing protein [Gammaproteobacteria bacterium]